MSLYAALSELVGSAALACAPVCDLALPDAAIEERAGFVAWAAGRNEMREIRATIEAIGRDVWVGAETRGLAQSDLDQHVRAAAALCSRLRPSAALMAEIAAAARAQKAVGAYAGEPIARRMALDILNRARAGGAIQGLQGDVPLREDVILFLLDRVFARLTDHDRRLMRLGPALAEFADEMRMEPGRRHKESEGSKGLAALGISRSFAIQLEAAGGGAYLAETTSRFGITERCLKRLIALIDGQATEAEGRLVRLESLAQWLVDIRDQLTRAANDDAEIRRLKSAAAAALAEGEFETAMDALRLVRRELREARRRTEERLHEEAASLRTQMAEEARATSRLAELLAARGEHAQAAELFAEAAMALPRADRDTALRFGLRRAEALLQHARERSDGPALAEALSTYANLVRQIAETADAKALAEACLGHGDALFVAGERDPGSNRLKDAIAIYQKAIQLLDRERDAAGGRKARISLARAMVRQGERDGSIEALRDAAQAFRDAASGISADKMPSEFTSVHMSLGAVLLALEEREGGKAPLIEAAECYRKAIAHLDSDLDGERWSEAQMNLGLALLGLGEQENSTKQLDEAVDCFRAVLDSTPRVRWPQRWALTQMNLGNALAAKGERDDKSSAFLEEAIVAYNMALEELLREAEPLKWAITQMNLGTALIRLGERKERRRHWLTAAAAMVPALEVFEQQGAEGLAEVTRRNLRRLQESWDSFLAPPSTADGPSDLKNGASQPRLAQAG